MLPSETMIWQPEFTDKTLSRKPGAVQTMSRIHNPATQARFFVKIWEICQSQTLPPHWALLARRFPGF
ncbi:hypothetical protein F0A08_25120 [Salmonella enterica subsp. enterica serovar Typhimurium]|nr:hypothetical protein C1I39_27820 [Escherichia coli]PNB91649.1 hypothetical protein C1I42_27835 [Escherichia coli]TIJ27338.1 hypothetical protein EYY14_26645 [Escherichia coli]TZF51964.1 hypothetical protein F0A08_25120 [Salmonella enterica subsp. enterica serovar Typhimurium]